MIAVDYGNKSNYLYGETTVISSFAEGENIIEILRGGEVVEEIAVTGYTQISRKLDAGYYTVRLKGTEYYTEFCVNSFTMTHTVEDGYITITVTNADPESVIHHMEFRGSGTKISSLVKIIYLTDEEKAAGVFTVKIPSGGYTYKISFENEYGIYTHRIKSFS